MRPQKLVLRSLVFEFLFEIFRFRVILVILIGAIYYGGIMSGDPLTQDEIRIGINALITKVSKMGLYAHIIDPYFDGFYITRKSLPLSSILTELIAHIYGQLYRLFFDFSKRHKTVSIKSIHNQLINFIDSSQLKGIRHIQMFKTLDKTIAEIESAHKKALKLYTNKYYAHTEIRSEEQAKKDYEDFKMSWPEIKELIVQAKQIINILWLYLDDSETDFAEGQYNEDRRLFWELINADVFKKP